MIYLDGLVQVFDTGTGAEIGTMKFREADYAYTTGNANLWKHQIQLRVLEFTGTDVQGTVVQGYTTCNGNFAPCIYSGTLAAQTMRTDADAQAEGSFMSSVANPGATDTLASTWRYQFFNAAWTSPSAEFHETAKTVRCDNATPGRPIGCIVLDGPSVFIAVDLGLPNFRRHLSDALASGLRGAWPAGAPLTRLTDAGLIDTNRRAACPERFPRPPNHSCDEYPFASSYEGAFTSGGAGRTFPWCQIVELGPGTGPSGYSACMIPATENSSGGGFLGSFYSGFRVIDRDPFWVLP